MIVVGQPFTSAQAAADTARREFRTAGELRIGNARARRQAIARMMMMMAAMVARAASHERKRCQHDGTRASAVALFFRKT